MKFRVAFPWACGLLLLAPLLAGGGAIDPLFIPYFHSAVKAFAAIALAGAAAAALLRRCRIRPLPPFSAVMLTGWFLLWVLFYGLLHNASYAAYSISFMDLGYFDHMSFNLLRGSGYTPAVAPIHYWSQHVIPILVLNGLLYLVPFPLPVMFFIQCAVLAAGGAAVYRLARWHGLAGFPSWLCCTLYFCYPATAYLFLEAFRPCTWFVPLFLWGHYYLLRGNALRGFLLLAWALCTIEHAAIFLAVYGCCLWLFRRQRGALLFAGAAGCWLALALFVLIPWFARGTTVLDWATRFGDLGSGPGDLIVTAVTRPAALLHALYTPKNIAYLGSLFVPLLLLPAGGWRWLIPALPLILLNLLVHNDEGVAQKTIYTFFQYQVVAVIWLALLAGISRLTAARQVRLLGATLVACLVAVYCWGPWPGARTFRGSKVNPYTPPAGHERLAALIAMVPDSATVCATDYLLVRFSHRPHIQLFGFDLAHTHWQAHPPRAGYYLLDLNESAATCFTAARQERYRERLRHVCATTTLLARQQHWVLLGPPVQPAAVPLSAAAAR